MSRPLVIEITEGDEPWIRFKSGNGKIMLNGESYQGGPDKAEQTIWKIIEKIQAGEYVIRRS